jgi:hypothetical protein
MTRLSRSPKPQLRAARGCCRIMSRYSYLLGVGWLTGPYNEAFGDAALVLLPAGPLSRFEMGMEAEDDNAGELLAREEGA